MISRDLIIEIEALFKDVQVINCPSFQFYDSRQEYREFCLFAVGFKHNQCTSVHVNIKKERFTAWRKKNFEKRAKKIPLQPYIVEFPEQNIIRIGFK